MHQYDKKAINILKGNTMFSYKVYKIRKANNYATKVHQQDITSPVILLTSIQT